MTNTRSLVLAAAVSMAAVAAHAQPAVTGAWSRPAAAGMTGAGFLTLENRGPKPDTLVGAESPLAARVEIHQSMDHNGVMMMMKSDRLALPPGGRIVFGPGGYHLMLVGLKQPLKVGDSAPLTLDFASGAKVQASLKVTITAP